MKKLQFAVVLTLACLSGLGIAAQAQENGVVTNVPFSFVVAGKTLPAGTYSVTHTTSPWDSHLVIRNSDSAAFVLPIAFDNGGSFDQTELTFEHVGNKYFLSKVKTPAGVYTIGTPTEMTLVAQKKGQETVSASGTN